MTTQEPEDEYHKLMKDPKFRLTFSYEKAKLDITEGILNLIDPKTIDHHKLTVLVDEAIDPLLEKAENTRPTPDPMLVEALEKISGFRCEFSKNNFTNIGRMQKLMDIAQKALSAIKQDKTNGVLKDE